MTTTSPEPRQNRWYGRVGAPIIWQLGPWVPGRRTTLEFLPAVWFFGNNNDYVGQTMKTDPLFQLDAHLTRDFTEHFWEQSMRLVLRRQSDHQRVSGDKLNNIGLGLTLGYQVNDNINLTLGYKSTINDSGQGTFAWTRSCSRSCTGGTSSSKARGG